MKAGGLWWRRSTSGSRRWRPASRRSCSSPARSSRGGSWRTARVARRDGGARAAGLLPGCLRLLPGLCRDRCSCCSPRRRSWPLAPLPAQCWSGSAMLTRVAGAALVASALVEAARARGGARREALAVAAGGIVAFGIWFVAIGALTQDPLGFMRGSAGWNVNSGSAQLARTVLEPSWEQVGWLLVTVLAAWAAVLLLRAGPGARRVLPRLPRARRPAGERQPLLAALRPRGVPGVRGVRRARPRSPRPPRPVALLAAFAIGQVVFAAWTISSTRIAP